MFKLKKILGAKSSVPEIRIWENDASSHVKAGCLYFAHDDTVSNELVDDFPDKLKIIAVSTVPTVDASIPIAGFVITKDMVFEAEIKSGSSVILVGTKVNITYDDNGDLAAVTAEEGAHDAIAIDVSNRKNNKVDIVFI